MPSPATPANGIGSHTFVVTATDAAGNHTTATVHYAVQYGFVGLLQPVDDGVGQTTSIFKRNSTVPLKFQLLTPTGPLSATASAALAASCDLKVSYRAVGTTSAPVDETVYTSADDSGGCFRWDGYPVPVQLRHQVTLCRHRLPAADLLGLRLRARPPGHDRSALGRRRSWLSRVARSHSWNCAVVQPRSTARRW